MHTNKQMESEWMNELTNKLMNAQNKKQTNQWMCSENKTRLSLYDANTNI